MRVGTVVTLHSGRQLVSKISPEETTDVAVEEAKKALIEVVGDYKPGDSGYLNVDLEDGWVVVPLAEVESVRLVFHD